MTPAELDPQHDYPLASHRPELIRTPTGKRLDEITMRAVLDGEVVAEDLRIAAETLRLQARIADSVGRPQLGQNFRRAAEMTALPDEEVLRIYNALRPGASTRQELAGIAEALERDHSATLCARLIREAAEVYERRGILAG
ncbi:glycerol dehydrogenase [Planotetraspora silvatica]|uniref:Glycerol dehydrogenase n=1 Tax=Planotetraspora silvatica TaxID=234614 RepID=A0A8J3UV73_9ACTN|nr:diol dehydratase small subunit [Planotetraspora silvatica]GII50457.1 glycerol dehydrogenase [Planotetraspora silvatica]